MNGIVVHLCRGDKWAGGFLQHGIITCVHFFDSLAAVVPEKLLHQEEDTLTGTPGSWLHCDGSYLAGAETSPQNAHIEPRERVCEEISVIPIQAFHPQITHFGAHILRQTA